MSALINACQVSDLILNTGKECDAAMGATAMLVAVPSTLVFSEADMADPVTWLKGLIHSAKTTRAYPFFGNKAPIRTITNNKESDVLVTLDDGSTVFLRYGFFNRVFETTSGGICYAKALQSLNKSGYSILEIDKQGQMLVHANADGTYSGLITDFMYSPSPMLADFKSTPYKNQFQISYSPDEYVQNGLILGKNTALLNLMGLIDCEITQKAVPSVTKITIGVQTDCANTDLIALIGAPMATASNYIVTNKLTDIAVVATAAIVSGKVELSGTFVTATKYIVSGAAPSVLFTNGVIGYDFSKSLEVTIP